MVLQEQGKLRSQRWPLRCNNSTAQTKIRLNSVPILQVISNSNSSLQIPKFNLASQYICLIVKFKGICRFCITCVRVYYVYILVRNYCTKLVTLLFTIVPNTICIFILISTACTSSLGLDDACKREKYFTKLSFNGSFNYLVKT